VLIGVTPIHDRQSTGVRTLTNAFSKKIENFKAAVALHYGYYNFVKTHGTIRCTLAMEAGLADSAWTVAGLVELVEG
jgi:hypothetical protein